MIAIAMFLLMSLAFAACGGGNDNAEMIEKVEAFREAREAGNFAIAASYLTEDPRAWFGSRDGDGHPLENGYGRYKEWDDYFRSTGEVGPWTVENNTVWAIATEMNDYYRLIERSEASRYRITYFFDNRGLIEGYLITDPDPEHPSPAPPSRIDEIEAWARTNHPDEWEYLRPGGELDPTGDRAARTRRLLNQWRVEVGLEPIE